MSVRELVEMFDGVDDRVGIDMEPSEEVTFIFVFGDANDVWLPTYSSGHICDKANTSTLKCQQIKVVFKTKRATTVFLEVINHDRQNT